MTVIHIHNILVPIRILIVYVLLALATLLSFDASSILTKCVRIYACTKSAASTEYEFKSSAGC